MHRWLHQTNRLFRAVINGHSQATVGSGWRISFGVSSLLHTAGLGLLALVAVAHPRVSDVATILGDWAETAPESAVQIDAPVDTQLTTGSSPGGRTGTAGLLAAGIETAREHTAREDAVPVSTRETVSPLDFEERLPDATQLAQSALGTKLGKGYALGGGLGSGFGNGEGDGTGSQFFDMETAGTKFVYILDGSASMTEPHSEARTRLDRVKIELVRSIGGLPEQMQFFVIFFNRKSIPMPAEKLQPATLDNKRKYLEWCVNIRGGGGTDPREALKKGLELQPDVIYLLTDGVFKDDVVGVVTKLITRGVAIHTFCFGDAAGEELVKRIAHKNHGIYMYIP
jgi:hypothetical protein